MVESWPPSLKVSAKLGWLLAENIPLDYMSWADFASSMAARRAGSGMSCDEVAWLFAAHFIKWPVAVARFSKYAVRACDALAERHLSGDSVTATAIVEALARVLQELSGHPFPIMHSRMSSKGRMHSATGIVVHSQWLGLLHKLAKKSDAPAGYTVLNLGVTQSLYALSPDRQDSIKLVEHWIAAIRETWPASVDAESFAAAGDAIVELVQRLRSMSVGAAGPLHWMHGESNPARSEEQAKRRKKAQHPAGYLAKHFAKCILYEYETELGLDWMLPPLCSLSMADVLRWTPDETHQCDAILEMSTGKAACIFGCSPLAISGHACFASAVDADQVHDLFRACDRDLFAVVARWQKELEAAWAEDDSGGLLLDMFSPVMLDFCDAAVPPAARQAAVMPRASTGMIATPQSSAPAE